MKLVTVTFLLVSLVLSSIFFQESMASAGVICAYKCKARCAKAELKQRCLKYCNICCQKCSCVPSVTYENKHECYCYRDMKNYRGVPKCP